MKPRAARTLGAAAAAAALLAVLEVPALAQANPPALDGLQFNRFAQKNPESLAQKPGGPTERIEIQSTEDHIDYVVKAYVLKEANAAEVYQLVLNAVTLEGGVVDRIAVGSEVQFEENGEVTCKYEGDSILVVTAPLWMIPYLDQTIEVLDDVDLKAAYYGTGYTYIRPKHRRPSELAELVAGSAASGTEILVPDDSRNVLYLEDTPSFVSCIIDALDAYDRPPDQIEARVRIYEIDTTQGRDVGLDWHAWKKSIDNGDLTLLFGEPGETNLSLEEVTAELSFNQLLATEFLNYLARKGSAKVITDTRVRIINGETATVQSTVQIPYVLRGFVDNDVIDSPYRDSPEALDADRLIREFVEGVIVTITPTIACDSLQLEISASVASHVGYTPSQSVPIITSSSVESVLDLSADTPAVIGGLTRTTLVDERAGIPWLKDVPGLRYLFSREVRREHKSHVVISIVPLRRTHDEAPEEPPGTLPPVVWTRKDGSE